MRTILRLGYITALVLLAGPSMAAGNDGLNVNTVLGPSCEFTSSIGVASVAPTPGETNIGRLGYTCNFVGVTSLVLQLPDGTNLRNGSNTVLYDVFWGIPPNPASPGAYQNWPFAANIAFNWITGATPNTEIGGDFYIRLNTAPTVAGTYTSTITYTLSP